MGLRTASLRRPHAAGMAPALTGAAQPQGFSLPPGPGSPRKNDRYLHLPDCHDPMSASPLPMGDQDDAKMGKMGLQKTPLVSFKETKSSNSDVDHLFGMNSDAVSGEFSQNVEEIMQQVIKTIEGKTDLNEEVFQMSDNLSNFEKQLLEDVDVMNITMEDEQETEHHLKESKAMDQLMELQKRHSKVERRLDFLRRRIYKMKARQIGQHVSGEVAGVFEQIHRSLKRPRDTLDTSLTAPETSERPRPMSYASTKTLVRKLELTAAAQATGASRQRHPARYFGSGSVEAVPARALGAGALAVPPWKIERKLELQKVAGMLETELGLVQREVDSEATESSSGDESCDELQTYGNPHQQYLTIQKRALWRYSTERASIASRWTWLQSQIADLEYRIRQHSDLQRHVRMQKGAVRLQDVPGTAPVPPLSPAAVNGYRGAQGEAKTEDTSEVCARTRPLSGPVRKRRLLQVAGLHAVSKKAARPATVRCGCVARVGSAPCVLCTGRTDATSPRPALDTLGRAEAVALLDPAFHPVFSMPEDTSQSIHTEAIMKTSEWQQRSTRMKSLKILSKSDRLERKSPDQRQKKLDHKKYERIKSSSISEKIKNKIRGRKAKKLKKRHAEKLALAQLNSLSADEEVERYLPAAEGVPSTAQVVESPSTSPLLQMQSISGLSRFRTRTDSYDIDNIVIPYSVAASTRVEKLQYKEILTPKWRIADPDFATKYEKNNGSVVNEQGSNDSDTEDVTDDAVTARHDRCEHDEKKKFLQYLRLPFGAHGRRPAVPRRADSGAAESSGANTPDPASPRAADGAASPPPEEPLPSVALLARRRTVSQSQARRSEEGPEGGAGTVAEVAPYDARRFPLDEETYDGMLKVMPENHKPSTNSRSQDLGDRDDSTPPPVLTEPAEVPLSLSGTRRRTGTPDSESTESAVGIGEFYEEDADEEDAEDPNDPEWSEAERARRERHGRR